MADQTPADRRESGDEDRAHQSALHKLEHAVHDHLTAAEVAMEEAAGYGEVTAAVKGAEAAVDPESELGGNEEDEAPSG